MRPRPLGVAAALVPLVVVPAPACQAQGGQPPGVSQPPGQNVRFEDLPPAIRLGVRAEAVRRATPVIPVVVLVGDGASFVEAIARWSPKARYPVLYDDGSALAREDIARFVRAFKPDRVVRYSAADEAAARKKKGEDAPAPAPPDDGAPRQAAIDTAVLRSWGAATAPEFVARLNEHKVTPPGVVLARATDPAWPAALALAAGRAQPILWVDDGFSGGVNDELALDSAERFCSILEGSCEKVGLPWRDQGDAIDAVTICLNGPAKVRVAPDKVVATTDLVGRRLVDGSASRETGVRWAWAGQVFGNESQASYRAMAALFLSARRAWLFDGYPDTAPWNAYDATRAADVLRKGTPPIEPSVDDTPRNDRLQWLRRCGKAVDAGLILVNSKGLADCFDAEPGQCRSGDVPVLAVPAAVHFVHSWSAQWPADRNTVAGRWLERGAYAYVGSVEEPYLQAFVPTPVFGARMVSMFPWGAAARPDSAGDPGQHAGGPTPPAWRIAVFGDPLTVFGPPPMLSDLAVPLEAVKDAADGIAPALKEKRYAEAIALLALVGRDPDAARLASGILRDEPKAFTPEVAQAAIPPLFRTGDTDALIEAFEATALTGNLDPWLRDMLWLAGAARVASAGGGRGRPDEKWVAALRTNLRADQPGSDAATIADAMAALYGREVALGMLRSAREKAAGYVDQQAADAAIARLSAGAIGDKR